MTEVRITGSYTFEDYLNSHRTAAARRRIILRVVICIVGVLMLLQESWWGRGLGILALAYAFFISGLIFRWLVKMQWEAYPAIQRKSADMRFYAQGIESTDDDGNPSILAWDRFNRWAEGSEVILLFMSSHLWLMVPKRLLTEQQLLRLREVLTDEIG